VGIERNQHGRCSGKTTCSCEQAHQQQDTGCNFHDGGNDQIDVRHWDARAVQDEAEALRLDQVSDADRDQGEGRYQARPDRYLGIVGFTQAVDQIVHCVLQCFLQSINRSPDDVQVSGFGLQKPVELEPRHLCLVRSSRSYGLGPFAEFVAVPGSVFQPRPSGAPPALPLGAFPSTAAGLGSGRYRP
jgi:hypothetical protein